MLENGGVTLRELKQGVPDIAIYKSNGGEPGVYEAAASQGRVAEFHIDRGDGVEIAHVRGRTNH